MTSLANLRVFATYPHQCSYLDDEQATTLFVDPNADIDRELYSHLSTIGFRRSGPHLYRPHCSQCQACIPARIPTESFRPSRGQRRVLRRNEDLVAAEVQNIDDDEYFQLYCRYIDARHRDGDMYPPGREQYDSFLTSEWECTRYVAFGLKDRLLAVAVMDELDCGMSAIYTYYDPDQDSRSLGTYAVLWQIQRARELGLPALYLGYWISNCRKMNYKTQFRPVELFQDGQWERYL